MSRPSRQEVHMEHAYINSKRATCFRLNVGAVIARDNNIIASGYNGVPAGQPHCSGNSCPGKHHCTLTIHAEENAIRRLPVHDRNPHPLEMYVTDSPCPDCVALILKQGKIKKLYFRNLYRVNEHLNDLKGIIEVYRVMPSGTVIDWFTNEIISS